MSAAQARSSGPGTSCYRLLLLRTHSDEGPHLLHSVAMRLLRQPLQCLARETKMATKSLSVAASVSTV